MKKTVLMLISLGFFTPAHPISLPNRDQVVGVLYIAAISAATYVGMRALELWWFAEEDHLDEMIKDIVKTIIIQHKVVTHHEIEESVSRVLQGKYPHLTRERIRKSIHQVVTEEVAPIVEQTSALESKIQKLLGTHQAIQISSAPEEVEESCCTKWTKIDLNNAA